MSIRILLQAIRLKTLTAALIPVLVGSFLSFALNSRAQWWIAALAALAATMIQIGTNLFNDAIDFKKGADTDERLGPVRVTQKGLMSARQVSISAAVSLAIAFLLGIPLVMHGGWPIVWVGLVSLVLAYAYTGGPFPLAYRGLGDLFVLIFFGLVAVSGTYYLHTQTLHFSALVAGTQVGLLATALIAINNLRDIEQDRKATKRTLAVRLGEKGAKLEITFLLTTPFFLQAYWYTKELLWAYALPLPVFLLAWKVVVGLWRTPPNEMYNAFLVQAAAVHLSFGIMLALGFWLGYAN